MWKVKSKDGEHEFEVYRISGRYPTGKMHYAWAMFYLGDVKSGVIHIVNENQLQTDYLHIPSENIMFVDYPETLDCRGTSFLPEESAPRHIKNVLKDLDKNMFDENGNSRIRE